MDLCKEKQISEEERDILIISYWLLPQENGSKLTKTSTYALQYLWRPALAHNKRLDSFFKAGAGYDHSPEWESSDIICARAVPSAHRSLAVAFAPSSYWTMGVLPAY